MINKAILVGRLGKDPEIRYTPEGAMVTSFSVATDEQWKNKNGEKQQKTEWHNITTFDKLAEICGKYLSSGMLVYVEGKILTRKWEDKQGQTRYTTGIIAQTIKMLSQAKEQKEAPSREPGDEQIPGQNQNTPF